MRHVIPMKYRVIVSKSVLMENPKKRPIACIIGAARRCRSAHNPESNPSGFSTSTASVVTSPTSHNSSLDPLFDEPPTKALHSHAGNQSALAAIGGYRPSTFGSHLHHLSSGTLSITLGICWPQPHQEAPPATKVV